MAEGLISWKNYDNLSLGKAVATFNRKIKKIESEENKMYLPKPLDFKKVKENILTRRQLNKVIDDLRAFNQEGAEELYENDAGQQMTVWEKEIIKGDIKRGISRLTRQLNSVDRTKHPIKTAKERDIEGQIKNLRGFESLTGFEFSELKRRAFNQGRLDKEMRKAIVYRENYMKVLEEHYQNFDNYDKLIKYLKRFKNPISFYERMKKTGNENIVDIYMIYDPDMAQNQFNEYVSNFIDINKMTDS